MKPKTSAKDFVLNLGAIVALYTIVGNLISLLFTVINSAYPQITNNYYYGVSQSISFPVATLIIFFPIYVLLMWVLEKSYTSEPEKRHLNIRRWLTFLTLFVAGLILAGDLVTILYYFIDGQELTTGFLLKVLSLFIVISGIFMYYISDIRDRLTASSRTVWTVVALVVIVGSISWGFAVLGSPRTQRLVKYDEQKISDLQSLNSEIQSYYQLKKALPVTLSELSAVQYYVGMNDPQTAIPYEYQKTSNTTYSICAVFNTSQTGSDLTGRPVMYGNVSWTHPVGKYCFPQSVSVVDVKLPM